MHTRIAAAAMPIAALAAALPMALPTTSPLASPMANAATVLTLEGGIVGMQHVLHFTPHQLSGDLCNSPNHCRPVDYFAFPGEGFNEQGATKVEQALDLVPDTEDVVLFGHSQGGQVIYTDLRRFAEDPANAPDPASLSWVSIGNPENKFGGRVGTEAPWLPDDTAYQGLEVIRQYDGWADWPDDPSNFVAVANAAIGMFTIHPNYLDVHINDVNNIRYTPDLPNGMPGNVTYLWAPTDVLPLVAWAGPLAPTLDNLLRPIVEAGYHRPVDIPDPTPPEQSSAMVPAKQSLPNRQLRHGGSGQPSTAKAQSGAQSRTKSETTDSPVRHRNTRRAGGKPTP